MLRPRSLAALLPALAFCLPAFAAPPPKAPPAKGKAKAEAKVEARPRKPAKATGARWVAATPDRMVEQAAARAKAGKQDALAGLATLHGLADRASPGLSKRLLERLGDGKGEAAQQARWLAASLEPQPQRAAPAGLVTSLAILGPFQDNAGRIKEHDLAEESPAAWADRSKGYSWGVYEVKWRPVVTPVTARGVPLDLYVHPRRESCTYVASRITLPQAGPIVVHMAATGAARLIWDGKDLGVSEEVHERALFDRIGARVEATAGDHLLAARVCAGSLDDEGRVRVRIAGPGGEEIKFQASRDLTPLARVTFEKQKITPLVEPIEKALKLPKKPSMEESLAAAILRRQGGVDDLRSPRAPGLLDAVTRENPAPDRLAMAGWVSPFGAARSGWLSLARELAVEAGDGETADFTGRRLAASRLDAGFADWAQAALNTPSLKKAEDAEIVMLRAMVRGELGGDIGRRAALASLAEFTEKSREKSPASLWDEVARLAHSFDPKGELRARDELARVSPERFDAERARAAAALHANGVVAASQASLEQGGLTSADDLITIGNLLVAAGRNEDAAVFLGGAAQIAPNLPALHLALAEARFALGKPDDKAAGERSLQRAQQLQPSDARVRAEVAFRARDTQPRAQRDERWIVGPDVLLAKARAVPVKKGEAIDRQPYWLRAVTQHEDQRVSQLIQYAREIVIAPRQQEELYENIPMEGDETEILRARVHRAGGEILFAEEAKSDQGRPMIRWPDLKTGDVVEVVVRSWTSGPIGRRGDPPFYFVDYGGAVSTHPLLYNEIVLDLPKEKPLAVDILNGKPDRQLSSEENGRTITRYIWDNPAIFADEPLAPKATEVFPTLVASSFASWGEFRTWYQKAVEGFTEPDEQVKAEATRLTRDKKTRDEKIKALFEFVADDIRYVNYVSGEWWLPNRPQQLLARRQGDCDDKAILLISLLKSIGIEATEVLIQTRLTSQPSVLLSKKAAIPLFDHGIAYLPAKDGQPALWLDATSPQSRLGPVPSMDTRTFSLFASEGDAKMVPTPRGSPDDYGADASWSLKLQADGGAELEADETHRGDLAFQLRTELSEKDARAPWIEQNLIAGWIPQAQLDRDVDFEGNLPGGQARVRYKARSLAMGRREGSDLVITLAPPTTLTSSLAPLPKRTLPVVLPPYLAPSKQTRTVRLVAPPGMKPGPLPPGGDEQGDAFGRAKLEISIDPKDSRVVLLTRSVTFDQETIPVEKYDAWRAWLSRVDSLMHRSVRFVPEG